MKTKPGVRKIPVSAVSVTGVAIALPYESTLERDYVTPLLFDQDVEEVVSQPLRIDYVDEEGKARHYTPDYKVVFRDGPTRLSEIKYRKDLDNKREELERKFKAARAYCEQLGWEFHVHDEFEIRTPRLGNTQFLWRHFVQLEKPLGGEAEAILEAFAARHGEPATQGEILEPLYADPNLRGQAIWCWWAMVVRRMLLCDLDVLLSTRTLYWPAARVQA